MTLSLDIRRLGMLGIALLLVMAVVGPGCLMFASSAMAMTMPMSHTSAPMSDCEDTVPGGSTMDCCPDSQPIESGQQPGSQALNQFESATYAAAVPETPQVVIGRAFASQANGPDAPIDHLTPLRL